ncbi:MAG: hypothetical protein NT091_02755 [Candidatus Falkowbacteria bacterium]|nr:hypothetical protein [Candidatus Falkowbacteria bacterium]
MNNCSSDPCIIDRSTDRNKRSQTKTKRSWVKILLYGFKNSPIEGISAFKFPVKFLPEKVSQEAVGHLAYTYYTGHWSDCNRKNFRLALADVLSTVALNLALVHADKTRMLQEIAFLSGLIGATETLPGFGLGIPWLIVDDQLGLVINLTRLSYPGELRARRVWDIILVNKNFDSVHIPIALAALCRIDPAAWREHLLLLK